MLSQAYVYDAKRYTQKAVRYGWGMMQCSVGSDGVGHSKT